MPKETPAPSAKSEQFQNQDEIVLGLLTAIGRDSQISQRTISRELDVALGLANAYLKRCVRKGFIKIKQVPRRRYAYYLTPKGFAEKTRLTGEYLSVSFTFFRRARRQMSDLLKSSGQNGWRRVALYGASDLAEIAMICARDHDIEIVGMVDPQYAGDTFSGLKVHTNLADFGPVDAVIVTTLSDAEAIYDIAKGVLPIQRVLAPSLVKLVLRESSTESASSMAAE